MALVDPNGTIMTSIKIDADQFFVLGNGEFVVISTGTPEQGGTVHGLDRAGKEIWKAPRDAGPSEMGVSALARAAKTDATLIAISTGKVVYSAGRPASRVFYHANDGFVFLGADEVWFVEESTGHERWRQPIAKAGDSYPIHADGSSFFVTHPDRSFEEIEYAHGTVLAKGTCAGNASEHPQAGACAGAPVVDFSKESEIALTRPPSRSDDFYLIAKGSDMTPERGDYHFILKGKDATLLARDPVGRTRWSVPSPVFASSSAQVYKGGETLVALAGEVWNDAERARQRALVVLDDSNGRLLFQRPLEAGNAMRGFTGTCWLMVTSTALTCFDARTGKDTWSVQVAGAKVAAWPLLDGGALLADGNPLTLSRIGPDGNRRWQTELPDADISVRNTDNEPTLMKGDVRWDVSDVAAITRGKDPVVLNLATGKLGKVHP